jgi:hypothetical protein
MTYIEKFKNPKWQKCRLKVMERDEYTCQCCGDANTTLNVHHKHYEFNKDPWDYPLTNLITLCEECHKVITDKKNEIKVSIDEITDTIMIEEVNELMKLISGLNPNDIELVKNFATFAYKIDNNISSALSSFFKTYFEGLKNKDDKWWE